ncbi:hypothetical protein K3495_g2022 [Podosphaera aphanis]|nr:hypothetical protein K3495_g2022 [Podosphaera aphanis]
MPRHKDSNIELKESDICPSGDELESGVMETAQKIVRRTKNTREDKRKAIQDDFHKRADDSSIRIDKHFESQRLKVSKARSDTWDKLEALNKNRQMIEGLILSSTKILESATLNMTSELLSILRDSIHDHKAVMSKGFDEITRPS